LSNLMKEKVFDEMFDIRDESSKEGIRVVIEVKKDRDIENLLNGLYRKTTLEDTYSVNLLAIKDQQPITFNLKGIIREFVDFQDELYTKEYDYMLDKANNRIEIVDGLIKATDVIDLIIEILRGSSSIKQAKDCLINGNILDIKFKTEASKKQAAKLRFTERQADAILSMQLSKLIGLEILKLHDEYEELLKAIESYKLVLENKSELYKIIKSRLKEFRKAFNTPRKTILDNITTVDYKEEIKIEDIYILIDRFGYTKSVDVASYSRASEENLKEYVHILKMENTDRLCLFTDAGNMHQVKAEDIPKARLRDKGVLIHTLCNLEKENVIIYTSFEELFESQLLFATKNGFIKQVSGIEYETNRSQLMATKLEENDKIVGVSLLSGHDVIKNNQKIILITEKGLSLGFQISDVPEQKRTSRGAKAITLEGDDYLEFMTNVNLDADEFKYFDKVLNARRVRNRKRGAKGQNAQLEVEE
ncbi:MAG TPA: DNA topoisomerase, partial [Clostridiales bacterium]|nr:DNA topoisomerase [Clostridiales bacterium]